MQKKRSNLDGDDLKAEVESSAKMGSVVGTTRAVSGALKPKFRSAFYGLKIAVKENGFVRNTSLN